MDKRALRAHIRARRRARTGPGSDAGLEREHLAKQIAAHGLAYAQLSCAPTATIASYEATQREPPTHLLNQALVAAGYALIVPVTLPDRDLAWRPLLPLLPLADHPETLGEHAAAPPQPPTPDPTTSALPPAAIAEAALAYVPALAVDTHGTRLGQGGGSYDRALPRRRPGTPVIAVLYDDELHTTPLPRQQHDCRVDAVLQPGGLRILRPPR